MMIALYVLLVVSVLTLVGVAIAGYMRVRKKVREQKSVGETAIIQAKLDALKQDQEDKG